MVDENFPKYSSIDPLEIRMRFIDEIAKKNEDYKKRGLSEEDAEEYLRLEILLLDTPKLSESERNRHDTIKAKISKLPPEK